MGPSIIKLALLGLQKDLLKALASRLVMQTDHCRPIQTASAHRPNLKGSLV